MSEKKAITIRLDHKVKERLDAVAQAEGRSRSVLAAEAIAGYLDVDEWQAEAIRKGLLDAEAGDFMSARELTEARNRWES